MLKRLCLVALAFALLGAALTASAGERKRIAGVIFQEDQFMRLVLTGMKDVADKHGGIDFVEGNSTNMPDKEITLINNFIQSRIDALLITPIGADSSVQALTQAMNRGIKVVQWNSRCDVDTPFVESSQYDLGKETGQACRKFIQEKLGGKAKIGILAFKSQVPEQSNQRRNGFWDQVKDLPGVELVAEQEAWLAEQGVKRGGDIMTANPSMNIIWSANEGGTVGSVMAIRNAGKAGKVYAFGTDTSEQLIEQLKADDNVLQAITGQDPYNIGKTAMEFGIKMLNGEEVPKYVSASVIPLRREDKAGIAKFETELMELINR